MEIKPIGNSQMDGKPIKVVIHLRYKLYKKDGQRQMGTKGRWQEMTDYGWKNSDWTPTEYVNE